MAIVARLRWRRSGVAPGLIRQTSQEWSMATKPPNNQSDESVPGVSSDIRKSIDASYDPGQDGSSPLETASVKVDEERNVWPIIWAVTVILMIVLTVYLLLG
jgi:hypothetical protein